MVIDAVLDALMRDLSQNIMSLYLYGSLSGGTYQPGQSDINLLIILDEEATIHQVRNTLRPVWRQHGPVLKRTPLVATAATFRRHLSFNPGLARHLVQRGSLLAGQPGLPAPLTHDVFEQLSQLARIAMHGSAAIAPSLLSERESAEAISCLRSLTRQLFDHEVSEEERATTLFSRIQADVLGQFEQHPSLFWNDQQVQGAPPLVQDLRAIYENENRLILLLPDSGPDDVAGRITHIDWDAVASRIVGQYRGLWVTTATQLRLILSYDSPAGYRLGSYNHAWGLDPIADLEIDAWRILRNFGRLPSTLLVDTLPQAYINSEDSDVAMLVHDLHNKLLTVQLQNELFCRMEGKPIAKPPDRLADRDLPMEKRIDGIYNHLNWWAEYYDNEMTAAQVQIT
jgi:predicted nucleotidyltransferase